MAVSGRRVDIGDAIITGSEEICDFYCQPCSFDKKSLPAEGYCVDCKEYLCGTCFKYHRKLSAMSHHALLDKKRMPRDKHTTRPNRKDICTDQCLDHIGKKTEYYCKTHDQLGCSACMTLSHRGCKGVSYIPDISDGIENTDNFVQLNNKLNDLERIVDEIERKIRKNCTAVEAISNESKVKIRECINEISELFDTLQKVTNQKVEGIRDKDMSAMEFISIQCDSVRSDIRSMSSDLDSKQKANQNSQLFVAMKNGEKEIKLMENKMKQIITNNTIRQYTFVPERQITDLINKLKQLGHFKVSSHENLQYNPGNDGTLEDDKSSIPRGAEGGQPLTHGEHVDAHEGCTTLKIANYREIIQSLTKEEEKQLNDTPVLVNTKIDKAAGIISISGPFRQADDARAELYTTIRNIEKHRNIVKESDTLYQLVRWQHEDVTATGIDLIAYDKTSNSNIERAYKDNRKNVELVDHTDGKVYVIDFEKLIDYPKGDESDSVKVIRKDMIKVTSDALPDTWTPMKDNKNMMLVNLAATDADYKATEQRFLTEVRTGPYSCRYTFDKNKVKVSKIERIQNKALYQQYAAKKKQIEGQKTNLPANMPLERLVWHDTTPDCVNSIQMHGFNRSYCRKIGIWFGAGAYFVENASYSARGWLSGANAPANAGPTNGYVFLVKALTGQFCKGNDKMRYLPAVDPNKPLVLYDSAVDDVANPMEFVIFNDTQAYPEYMLTFTKQ